MTIHHPARFQIHWWNQDQIDQQLQVQPPTEAVVAPTPSTTAPERLLNRLDYQYPYSKATQTTSYQSVSELKRHIMIRTIKILLYWNGIPRIKNWHLSAFVMLRLN